MRVPILAYHKVNNKFEWGINTVPIRRFETQLQYLKKNSYYSISLDQYIQKNYRMDATQRPVIITFDDADESVYDHGFPMLKNYGFTATLFVISDFVGMKNSWDANLGGIVSQHLNWEQIQVLADQGWEIGSHTATHRDLRALPEHEARAELVSSREVISAQIGIPVHFISYPFNRFDAETIALARKTGYRGGCALSVTEQQNSLPGQFAMPRFGVYSIDTLFWFKKKLSNSKIERVKQRVISFASQGTILYQRYRK